MPNLITADSKPDYDDWGPDEYWSCNQWIDWHKALKKAYGKKSADEIWMTAWNQQDSWESNYNWCKYSGFFNSYVRKEELDASWWLPNILNDTTSVVEDAGEAASNTTKIAKWIIPALLIIGAIILILWAYKKFKNG